MQIGRRDSLHLLGGGLLAAMTSPAMAWEAIAQGKPPPGPRLLEVRRGAARVTILGFGEARDETWFSSRVRDAFDASDRLWLENAPPGPGSTPDPATARKIEVLSHTSGQTFYDCLSPAVAAHARKRVAGLGIADKDIAPLRPWRAYNVIMSAYFRRHPQAETKYVDEFLAKRAVARSKPMGFEFPSYADFASFMADMSPTAQSQYISWLLTYLDEQDRGLNDRHPYDWAIGHGPKMTRSLQRMINMAELYAAMQTRRNQWWARKIVEILDAGGNAFIGIGYLHIIGPAGIPEQLRKLGQRATMA